MARAYKQEEHGLQSQVIEYALLKKCLVFRFNSGAAKTKNSFIRFYLICNTKKSKWLSDLMLVRNGHVFFLEIKSGKGKQSHSQKEFQELSTEYGAKYLCSSDWNEIIFHINQFCAIN